MLFFFFSSRRRHTSWPRDWSSDVCSSDLTGHSHHLYFTENGWYDNYKRLLFQSDRENQTNLFSINLETGKIKIGRASCRERMKIKAEGGEDKGKNEKNRTSTTERATKNRN